QRVPVRPPPEELPGVTKSSSLELVVLDLHDQFRPQRHPREVLLGVPPADCPRHSPLRAVGCVLPLGTLSVGPVLPRVPLERVRPIGRQRRTLPPRGLLRARSPDRAPAPRPAPPAGPWGTTLRRRCAAGRRRRCR